MHGNRPGRFILQTGAVADVFEAVHDIFSGLINEPAVDRQGMMVDAAFREDDLKVANALLDTLERLYPLKVGRSDSSTMHGFATSEMHAKYVQVKYWQRMLNTIYGPKET